MSFSILPTPLFDRELKKLAQKHASIKGLAENPNLGKSLGNNCFKIRMSVSSKNKGKSGGARIITYVKIMDEKIYLLSIYDKSESDIISDADLTSRIKNL